MPFPIGPDALKYLQDTEFSSGFRFPLPRGDAPRLAVDRYVYLESVCRNKRVLHLGCCDHPPLIRQKIAANSWLHGRLTKVASCCLGLDIALDAVSMVRDQLGYANVIHADLAQLAPAEVQQGKPWDLLVAGEIIEHLDNPVQFLSDLRSNLKGLCPEIIITAPNAFRRENLRRLLAREECINSDHRYWFTPYTLAKVLTKAGFMPRSFDFVENDVSRPPRSISSAFRYWQIKKHPALREILIMEASFA